MSRRYDTSGTTIIASIIAAGLLLVGAVALIILFGALTALPVMWLWNYLFTGNTSILGSALPTLDFWHAWALLILSGLLVRSGSSSTSAKAEK